MKAPTKTAWCGPLVFHTVEQIDHVATGDAMRVLRKSHRISLRDVARRMKLSAPFVSDLERGRRNWDASRAIAYMKAVTEAQRAQLLKVMKTPMSPETANLLIGKSP